MATYRYYLSSNPGTPSPPSSELKSIEAESPSDVVARLITDGRLPPELQTLWVHVLVWTSNDGHCRGFESTRLASLQNRPSEEQKE